MHLELSLDVFWRLTGIAFDRESLLMGASSACGMLYLGIIAQTKYLLQIDKGPHDINTTDLRFPQISIFEEFDSQSYLWQGWEISGSNTLFFPT